MSTFKVKNDENTPTETIQDQLLERRPLPLGRKEFEEWSDRIISGALLSADIRSQKFVLADVLLHLGPTEDHKEDAYFIHTLRKMAVNQVAIMIRDELKAQQKAEIAAQEAEKTNGQAVGPSAIPGT